MKRLIVTKIKDLEDLTQQFIDYARENQTYPIRIEMSSLAFKKFCNLTDFTSLPKFIGIPIQVSLDNDDYLEDVKEKEKSDGVSRK